jgi:hypothetical protein
MADGNERGCGDREVQGWGRNGAQNTFTVSLIALIPWLFLTLWGVEAGAQPAPRPSVTISQPSGDQQEAVLTINLISLNIPFDGIDKLTGNAQIHPILIAAYKQSQRAGLITLGESPRSPNPQPRASA